MEGSLIVSLRIVKMPIFARCREVRSHSNHKVKNMFMLSVRISSYGCTREVWRARKMRKSSSRRSREQPLLFECSIHTVKSMGKFFYNRATTRICAKKPFIVIECNSRPYWLVKNTTHFILWFERELLIQLTDNRK